jgi:hypothetical protein
MEAVEEGTCTVMYFVNMVTGEPDWNESGEDDLAMRAWKTRQEAAAAMRKNIYSEKKAGTACWRQPRGDSARYSKTESYQPIFWYQIIKMIVSQYCGHWSSSDATWYIQFRKPNLLEAWERRKAVAHRKVVLNGHTIQATIGATVSHAIFLSGNLDDNSNCEAGVISFPNCKTMGGQAAQGLHKITLREEFAKMNELTSSIMLLSGVQARVSDKSLLDSLEGTLVWEYDPLASPQIIVQLYKGLIKVYTNQINIYEGSIAVVEHKNKDQAARLEIAEYFIRCGHQADKMHIKSIAIFIHNDDRVEVARRQLTDKGSDINMTCLE